MRHFIRVGVPLSPFPQVEQSILEHIVNDLNLTIDWFPLDQNHSYLYHLIHDQIDCFVQMRSKIQRRLDLNLTFSYPMLPVGMTSIIPDPDAPLYWTSLLAIFRLFSLRLWVLMALVFMVFVGSMLLANSIKLWFRWDWPIWVTCNNNNCIKIFQIGTCGPWCLNVASPDALHGRR